MEEDGIREILITLITCGSEGGLENEVIIRKDQRGGLFIDSNKALLATIQPIIFHDLNLKYAENFVLVTYRAGRPGAGRPVNVFVIFVLVKRHVPRMTF